VRFNPDRLAEEAECPVLPPSGGGRATTSQSSDVLDTLPTTPNTALLWAQEAKDRLREIVEGFFFRGSGSEMKGDDRPARKPTIISLRGGSNE
jgi:hypothetical protein